MSQQQMNSDEMNSPQREAPYNNYQTGYRDPQDPFTDSSYAGQKISFNSGSAPSAGQRLALAIVSLGILIPLIAIITGTAFEVGFLGVVGGLIGIGLVCITIIAVNYFFNARH